MDLVKRISNLKESIATAKAEKSLAEKKIKEIKEKLEAKGIKIEDLKDEITDKSDAISKLEKQIEEKVRAAENELESNSGKTE